MQCAQCGKALSVYDVGFYKRFVNRGATTFRCIACTSAYYGITEARAWELIRHYQRTGCTLFPPEED